MWLSRPLCRRRTKGSAVGYRFRGPVGGRSILRGDDILPLVAARIQQPLSPV
jgi:hypothetical protein